MRKEPNMKMSRARGLVLRAACMGAVLALGGMTALASPASASTLGGTATIADPISGNPLASGGSTTPFTVTLPAGSACSGDTANHGFHVYSYLVKKGVDVTTVTFINFPSMGFGFVDNAGTY